jgi:hypothetical protein
VKITDISSSPQGFHAVAVAVELSKIDYWHSTNEIIYAPKERKGNFIGGHQVYQ